MSAKPRPATEQFSGDRVIILGVAESDCHVVANKLIEYELRLSGFNVINLGACTPVDEFVAAFQSHPYADALVIGSLNGHAYEDLKAIRDAKSNLLISCPIIVGGNLGVTRAQAAKTREELLALGVEYVLEDAAALPLLLHQLPRRNVFTTSPE
ncbi:cobalamin-dependent protein (plasmid) [Sinorhizobium numidicum]|uniref:Cobalamin-dependent protein n=1 Tax=Sinorhizobium numidicum TaxID=680248 RepID=A0ABY8D5U6_9HYPH|nr:cobalamin-dependent protein [Sinorhizobium numidicum]WEX79732.1 cobalamin-dependent protein [Sinorhizobium numidicum]WEX85702.1 cobalamin-dependent protein [Sinorhizobium numidicum]